MRSDLLLTTQSFMDTFAAPNYSERNKVSSKDSSFTPSQSKSQKTKDDESFEAFMNDLKARHEAEKSQKNTARKDDDAQSVDTKNDIKAKPANPFFTQVINTTSTEENLVDSEDIAFDIYTQMEEIVQELERLMAAQETISTEIPKDDSSALKELKILSLFAHIAEDAGQSTEDTSRQTPDDILTQAMTDLRLLIENNKEALITLNKSPEDMAELQRIIEDILKAQIDKQNEKMLEELAAQWATVDIVKAEEAPLQNSQTSIAQTENAKIISDPLSKGAQENLRYDNRYTIDRYAKAPQNADQSDAPSDLPQENIKDSVSAGSNNKASENAVDDNTSDLLFHKLLNGQTSLAPAPIVTAQGDLLYTDQNGTVIASAPSTSTQPSLINNAAHAPHSSQPHPATQAIVTTITKAIKSGETSEIKIQLDPPELGRVEVKMSIDQDNITKIILTSEKAETHTLLQRDSHVLQQLLSDSGVLPDGSSLSFELSDGNNQNFASNKGKNGNLPSTANDGYSEIIETTMDWQVDPRTGTMHYNILV